MTSTSPLTRKVVRLPRSSTRLQKQFAHIKLVERVRPIESTIAFEGKIYPPGSNVLTEEMGANPVAVECVGPVGPSVRGTRRDILWILWKYDWGRDEWGELARAQSVNADWVMVLREPAIRALNPIVGLRDVIAHWQGISGSLMDEIDAKLELESPEIKISVLSAVYAEVAGRIALTMAA